MQHRGTIAARMTANDTSRVGSDNSVSHRDESTEFTVEHDTRNRRIAEEIQAVGGTTTRRDLLSKIDEQSLKNLDVRLNQLADDEYIDIIGEEGHQLIVLTHRGERLVRGEP